MMSDTGDLEYLRVQRDTTTLRERAATALRTAIFSMHLKPAQRLVERDLCQLTGVSRSSIREALRDLEAEGLISRAPGGGMRVAVLTEEDAREIYEVRSVLEAAAGRHFAQRASRADIADLKAAFSHLKQTRGSDTSAGYVDALDGVYDVLLRGAGNRIARQLIATLRGRIRFLRAVTSNAETKARQRKTIALMGEIVDAACTGDAKKAASRCRKFVERSARFASRLLQEQSDIDATGH